MRSLMKASALGKGDCRKANGQAKGGLPGAGGTGHRIDEGLSYKKGVKLPKEQE